MLLEIHLIGGVRLDSFDKLLSRFDPDRERGAEIYERFRRKLILFFEQRGCSQVADELADLTFDVAAKKLDEGVKIHAANPYSYLYGIALNVRRSYLRAPRRTHPYRPAGSSVTRSGSN